MLKLLWIVLDLLLSASLLGKPYVERLYPFKFMTSLTNVTCC